jgi:hypothetical protein
MSGLVNIHFIGFTTHLSQDAKRVGIAINTIEMIASRGFV